MFKDLPKGKYDLVILAKGRLRIEGFQYVPVNEFDPFFPPDASTDDETRQLILDDIKKSPHYENKVEPLYLGGDKKAVRVLVMLHPRQAHQLRERVARRGHRSATKSGNTRGTTAAWQKEKRTKVLDRLMLAPRRASQVDLALGPEARRHRREGRADYDAV